MMFSRLMAWAAVVVPWVLLAAAVVVVAWALGGMLGAW
jgi:hypothetical protein